MMDTDDDHEDYVYVPAVRNPSREDEPELHEIQQQLNREVPLWKFARDYAVHCMEAEHRSTWYNSASVNELPAPWTVGLESPPSCLKGMSSTIIAIRRKAAKDLMSAAADYLHEKAKEHSRTASTFLQSAYGEGILQATRDKCDTHIALQVQKAQDQEVQDLQEQCNDVMENKVSDKDIFDPARAVIERNEPPPEPPKSDPGPVRGRRRRRRTGRPYNR